MRAIDADLHLHSTASDGTLAPAALVALASERGLRAIALTDHDTLDGLAEARRAADTVGLEFVGGVELSCELDGGEVHLLGYFVDEGHEELARELALSKERRVERGRAIVAKLNRLGVPLSYEAVALEAGAGAVGRPHVARALVSSRAVGSIDEAFLRFLRRGAPAYVAKVTLSTAGAIALVRRAGGVPVLAHPGLYRERDVIQRLAAEGIAGLEVWHPKHSREQARRFEALAARIGLVPTGGSDFHDLAAGDSGPGAEGVPLDAVERLRAAAR